MIGEFIFIGIILSIPVTAIVLWYVEIFIPWRLFKQGRNPYHRICKKCGCNQELYSWNIEDVNESWWEDVNPIGDDPNCKCHKYSDYKSLL